jgi:hypothetical protein
MKASLVLLAAAGIAVAAASGSSNLLRLPPGTSPGQQVLFGHVQAVARKGGRWELRFDPAWFLSGVTAERAAVEDKVIQPGEAVPNDNYVVEEGHRLLTYVVSPTAHITVLTKGLATAVVPVAEFAQIVKGRNPKHRPLFAPGSGLGFWIRVGTQYPNPVLSIDQQYHP